MDYTTALYLRLSVDDDNTDESASIQSQRHLLQQFAAADPVLSSSRIIEFSDDGWSGTSFERPRVKDLLEMARRGSVNCIIVKDLSRWGRNYIEVCEYIERIFPFLGIRFVSVNDRYDSADFKGSAAPTDVVFNSIMHDVYCKDLSFKVRQSYIDKAKKGEFLCGVAPFGFEKSKTEKNKLVIDEEAASVVRRIFGMSCEGMSNMRIAAALNSEGVDTPLAYRRRTGRTLRGDHSAVRGGGVWSDKNVRTILTDERYTGVQVSGKTRKPKPGSRSTSRLPESEWIKVPGAHEAIVSDDVFAQANAGITRFKIGSAPKQSTLFAGKIRCGSCGRALKYISSDNPSYYCNGVRLNIGAGCFDGRFYVEDLKEIVLDELKIEAAKAYDKLAKRKQQGRGLSVRETIETELKQIKARLELLDRRGFSLYEDFAEGRIDKDSFRSAQDSSSKEQADLEKRTAALMAQLSNITDTPEPSGDEPRLERVLKADDLTDEMLALVDCVVVYDTERIEIRFSFGDTNVTEG